jgi:dihydrodipicolinate synthase/N-acetylneuraminate lyase
MAAEIRGILRSIFFVRRVVVLALEGSTDEAAGINKISSKVNASGIFMHPPYWMLVHNTYYHQIAKQFL